MAEGLTKNFLPYQINEIRRKSGYSDYKKKFENHILDWFFK